MVNPPSTLLIWEKNPESLTFYLIPNEVADKYRNFLAQAHNTHIGSGTENEGTHFVSNAIAEGEYEPYEGSNEAHHGLLKSYKLEGSDPIMGVHITSVYHTGFLL